MAYWLSSGFIAAALVGSMLIVCMLLQGVVLLFQKLERGAKELERK